MSRWIWEHPEWPNFKFDAERVLPSAITATRATAPLIALANELSPEKLHEFESQILLKETLSTSMIEQEVLDRDSVRSSIARHLGLPNTDHSDQRYESFTQVFFEAVRGFDSNLSHKTVCEWHASLFIEKPILKNITLGEYRDEPMSIISGHFGRKERIHFEAPCTEQSCVDKHMTSFINWLNDASTVDYIRAAIAKFWFVTIHPFDDGNGRLSRIIAERCLAQADQTHLRLYSISTEIEQCKSDYYDILERCQTSDLDITDWVIWFLQRVSDAANESMKRLKKVRQSTFFWDYFRHHEFNERQKKLLLRMLETPDFDEGIAKRKYKNLVSTSDATAARDLKELVEAKALIPTGQGRSVKYFLNIEILD